MTELMKQYEKETGKVMSHLMEIFANAEKHSKEELFNVMVELYTYAMHLEAQLTWRPVSEKPEKGKEVILSYVDCYGHRINVLGSYVRRFDEEAGSTDDEDIMEYSDEKDEYYLKEGWYEHTTHSDYDCWLLHEKIDKWLPIPPAPEGE